MSQHAIDNTLPQSAQKFIDDKNYIDQGDAMAFASFVNQYLSAKSRVAIVPAKDKGATPGFLGLWYDGAAIITNGSVVEENISLSLVALWNEDFFQSIQRDAKSWKLWLDFQFTAAIRKQFFTRKVNEWDTLLERRAAAIQKWSKAQRAREELIAFFGNIKIGGPHDLHRPSNMEVGVYTLSLALDWYIRGQIYGMVLSEKDTSIAVGLHRLRWPPKVLDRKDFHLGETPESGLFWGEILLDNFQKGRLRFDTTEMCGRLVEARKILARSTNGQNEYSVGAYLDQISETMLALGVPLDRRTGYITDLSGTLVFPT